MGARAGRDEPTTVKLSRVDFPDAAASCRRHRRCCRRVTASRPAASRAARERHRSTTVWSPTSISTSGRRTRSSRSGTARRPRSPYDRSRVQGTGSDFTSSTCWALRKSSRLQALGDDDRVAAVGREVHVVRIVDRNRADRRCPSSGRSASGCCRRRCRRTASAGSTRRRRVEAAHRLRSARRPEGRRVDHVDRVALAVRHVHQ